MRGKILAGTTSFLTADLCHEFQHRSRVGLPGVSTPPAWSANGAGAGDATWTAISLATATLGTFTSGGWIADGSLTGAYSVGIPNAALASGGALG